MKKKVVFAVSALMAMSLMTGCGAANTAPETEATTVEITEAVQDETEATTEEVTEEETEEVTEEATEAADGEWAYGEYTYTGEDNIIYAIDFYICDELAKGYEAADVGIPNVIEVSRDDSDPEDIKVWGEFEYFTYNLIEETNTLECQAGGSYPGCFHIKETDAGCGYVVTEYEPVADGADFDSSAQEIFGDKYDAFMEVYSNDELKEEKRGETIAEYVVAHNVPATQYQDYGWDPIELNLDVTSNEGSSYIGGLFVNDGESDINMAFFLEEGELNVIVQEGENFYNGAYTLEDVELEDGTAYSEITVEGKTFGYQFEDEEQTYGFIVDQEGNKHSAIKLDESVALDMKAEAE